MKGERQFNTSEVLKTSLMIGATGYLIGHHSVFLLTDFPYFSDEALYGGIVGLTAAKLGIIGLLYSKLSQSLDTGKTRLSVTATMKGEGFGNLDKKKVSGVEYFWNSITMIDALVEKRKQSKRRAKEMRYSHSANLIPDLMFQIGDITVTGDMLIKFLRVAEGKRKRGKGLGRNYWKHARHPWWDYAFYDAIIFLIRYAEDKTGRTLIIRQTKKWSYLCVSYREAYKLIAYSFFPDRFDPTKGYAM